MRIVIADDHPLFLLGLQYGLEEAGATVVASVANGVDAVEAARRHRPDAVVLDVRMPQRDGIEACRAILEANACRTIVVLTTWTDAHVVDAARRAGARAMISKETSARSLLGLIMRLQADAALQEFPPVMAPALTERELQVLTGIAQGLTRKAIASKLGISPETVKDHVTALFSKLDANDRVSVVTRAVNLGVMPLPPDGGGDCR